MELSNVTIIAVFAGGIFSFISPCVLPLIPAFSAVLAGSFDEKKVSTYKIYFHVFCFLLGFTFIFVLAGATASLIGRWFFDYQPLLKKIGAVMIIVMGISLTGLIRINLLEREYKPFIGHGKSGLLGAFLLGMAFAIGWTPCTGPILATILFYAGSSDTVGMGSFLLFIYAMGFSIPFFIMTALLRNYIFAMRKFYNWLPMFQKFAGLFLILIGVAVWFDWVEKGLGIITSFF